MNIVLHILSAVILQKNFWANNHDHRLCFDPIRVYYRHWSLKTLLLIFQFVTNQICSRVTDLLSFVSLSFLCNPADFLPDYLFHLQCYIWAECFKRFYDTDDVHLWQIRIVLFKAFPIPETVRHANYAQTECQFRYCGTAIPFLTVRSTARWYHSEISV